MRMLGCVACAVMVAAMPLACGRDDAAKSSASKNESSTLASQKTSIVAATNMTLACAVREVWPEAKVVVLASGEMCPGHVDFRPSQIERLQGAVASVRFDFQKSIDRRMKDAAGNQIRCVAVHANDGLAIPANYVDICVQIAESLKSLIGVSEATMADRLAKIDARMSALAERSQQAIASAGVAKVPVLASVHQSAFCRWLGFDVIANVPAGDAVTAETLDETLAKAESSKVQWILANGPEGRQSADRLAEALSAKVIVLENFAIDDGPAGFDRLVDGNVAKIVEAMKK